MKEAQVFVSLVEDTGSSYSCICKHLFQYLKKNSNHNRLGSQSNTDDDHFELFEKQCFLFIKGNHFSLINPIQIQSNCSCEQEACDTTIFPIICNKNIWILHQEKQNIDLHSHTFIVSIQHLALLYTKDVANSVTIQIEEEMNENSFFKNLIQTYLYERCISSPSFIYHDLEYSGNLQLSQNINILSINASNSSPKDDFKFPKLYFIDRSTEFIFQIKESQSKKKLIKSLASEDQQESFDDFDSLQSFNDETKNDIKKLCEYIDICLKWPMYFPNSLFSPPCGILLKTLSVGEATR